MEERYAMKEIITFFIVSGGVGFFNLYLAQETDHLYFGKYNKEERLAWLSIFTLINYSLVNFFISVSHDMQHKPLILFLLVASLIVVSLVSSFLLPIGANWGINKVRILLNKPRRAYLPPINTFFQDIEGYELYSFDFDGKLISSGTIAQGTEERQDDLSILVSPTSSGSPMSYSEFIEYTTEKARANRLEMRELTDYSNKIHLVKIKAKNNR